MKLTSAPNRTSNKVESLSFPQGMSFNLAIRKTYFRELN